MLIVGGSHAEIPLIQSAQRLGYRVATTGNRPADLGHELADRYMAADFSDPDEIVRVAAEIGAIAVVSGCNDFAAISTAYAAEQLGLPGHDSFETTVQLHHKHRFRELLTELGLPTPLSGVVSSAEHAMQLCERLGYPVIVKPVDLTGGKGISICQDATEVADAVRAALSITREAHIVVEQFMEGSRHGFTCFIDNGRVGFRFGDDEQYYLNPFLVSGTSTPSSMPPDAIDELVDAVELIASRLDLADGLMHTQCILTEHGPRIVELCRRCPGDLYPVFVEVASGYDYAAAVVSAEAGLPISAPAPDERSDFVVRHCIMGDRAGTLQSITMTPKVKSRLVRELMWWTSGQQVANYLTEKFGIIFLRLTGEDEMQQLTDTLTSDVTVRIE